MPGHILHTGGALASQRLQAQTCEFPYRDKAPRIAKVSYSLFGVAMLFVIARFISRFRRLHGAGFGRDDFTVAFCVAPMAGMTVVAYFEDKYGTGRDVWTVPMSNLEPFALWFYIGQPFYIVVTYLTKLSLVFLYLRIWHEERRSTFRITCWIVATSLIMCTIGCVLVCIFPCQPISYAWRQVLPGVTGTCSNRLAAAFAFSGINIAYDVIVLLIPIPRFIGLDIPLHKKIGVCSCFLVGFAVTACSIIRLTHLFALNNSRNPTWDFAEPGFWSLIEVYSSVICCCTPAMAGFLRRLYKFGLETRWSSIKGSISSGRSDSRLMGSKGDSNAAPHNYGSGEAAAAEHRVYLDEKGRVRSAGGSAPDDMLHVEKASPISPGRAQFASLDGMDDRERPRTGLARIPSEANIVKTVLQHPGSGSHREGWPIERLSSDEEREVMFEARRR
ncbi:hypothetical protein Slin15195_G123620 [Septoria linicola]|uniref:Rhodopsin domain-containing protein n=1 Tax=Septoria linicola TaxID=215465 RepID=A0A9Q9ERY2_9PEZI|nr:hypothetical protein Slin15195_G123620 [Septoria linicola]